MPKLGTVALIGVSGRRYEFGVYPREAREPDAYDGTLTKAEASRRIDALKAKLAKGRNAGSERPG